MVSMKAIMTKIIHTTIGSPVTEKFRPNFTGSQAFKRQIISDINNWFLLAIIISGFLSAVWGPSQYKDVLPV